MKYVQPRIINHSLHKDLSNEKFRKDLKREIASQVFVNNDDRLQKFCDINIEILNKHVPRKKRCIRGNQMPFLIITLSKAIMERSRL